MKALVETTVERVGEGASQVRSAGTTMDEIVGNVANVTTIISEIRHAATEQTRGIQEVNHAVTQLDEMVQQNAALVEQSSAAAATLQRPRPGPWRRRWRGSAWPEEAGAVVADHAAAMPRLPSTAAVDRRAAGTR